MTETNHSQSIPVSINVFPTKIKKMTERNLTYELLYTNYIDDGDDVESIDYRSLIHILTELMNRIEKLEKSQHTHSEMNND